MKDFYLVTLIGFFVGWLVLLPFKNIGFIVSVPLVIASVVGFTFFALFAFLILKFLSRFWLAFEQLGKFAAVGTLSALIYLEILNFFMFITGIARGFRFSAFLIVAFFISQINSYLWNKFWTFESKTKINIKEYLYFIILTLIGGGINVGVASFLVNFINISIVINPKIWANIAAVIAIIIAASWNFLSYRYIIFKLSNKFDKKNYVRGLRSLSKRKI